MRIISLIILLFFIPLLCSAGTIDPNIDDNRYIKYGQKFECVGRLCGYYSNKTMFCASAVAINDNHILTAAHVVEDSESCTFTINNKNYCISKVVCHKDFNKNTIGIKDIAIGYSVDRFELDFYPALYEDSNETGKVCSLSGYGITGNFLTGAVKSDIRKRAGSNIIDSIFKDLLICSASKSKNRTELEFLIASGDSGGGLFIDGKLAGINSCVISDDGDPNSSYGDESGHTRISLVREWLLDNIRE